MQHIEIAKIVLKHEEQYAKEPGGLPLVLLIEQWEALLSLPKIVMDHTTVADAALQVVKACHAINTLSKLFPDGELPLDDYETCRRAVGSFRMQEESQDIHLEWSHEGNEKWTALLVSRDERAATPTPTFEVLAQNDSLAGVAALAITALRQKFDRWDNDEPTSAPAAPSGS